MKKTLVIMLLAALSIPVVSGCVRRTMRIETAPSGARVFLNDQEIGRSPVETDFLWYGTYDVIIRKEGYQTLKTSAQVDAPWYQVPPFDLFAEAFCPSEIHDHHTFAFDLDETSQADPQAVLQRAEETRQRALFETE